MNSTGRSPSQSRTLAAQAAELLRRHRLVDLAPPDLVVDLGVVDHELVLHGAAGVHAGHRHEGAIGGQPALAPPQAHARTGQGRSGWRGRVAGRPHRCRRGRSQALSYSHPPDDRQPAVTAVRSGSDAEAQFLAVQIGAITAAAAWQCTRPRSLTMRRNYASRAGPAPSRAARIELRADRRRPARRGAEMQAAHPLAQRQVGTVHVHRRPGASLPRRPAPPSRPSAIAATASAWSAFTWSMMSGLRRRQRRHRRRIGQQLRQRAAGWRGRSRRPAARRPGCTRHRAKSPKSA